MKNYYELLEVSEKASQEVIKKAYITLVKKYHPDLQPDGEKKVAEERIKEINEAYEVLMDDKKRHQYDISLQNTYVDKEKFEKVNDENIKLKQELNRLINLNKVQNPPSSNSTGYSSPQKRYYTQKNFYRHYYQPSKSNLKDNLKKFLFNIISIILTCIILYFLYHIPFIKDLILNMHITKWEVFVSVIIAFIIYVSNQ